MSIDAELEISEPVLFSLLRHVRSTLTRTEFFTHKRSEYSQEHEISIWAGSFNLNGRKCMQSISEWLPSESSCDVLAFAFQEIVELTASNAILGSSTDNVDAIECLVSSALTTEHYVKLSSIQLVGLYLTVYVKSFILQSIRQVSTASLATGFGGMLGNKGAVAVRMLVRDRPLVFVNVHLSSGEKPKDCAKRQSEVDDILSRMEFGQSVNRPEDEIGESLRNYQVTGKGLLNDPSVIFLGDMNFRLEGVTDAEARAQISQGQHKDLFEKDQLHSLMKRGHLFQGWTEGPVDFPPTFKFKLGTTEYSGEVADSGGEASSGGKKRVPAWCDRLVFRGKHLQQLTYYSVPSITASDHKPVASKLTFISIEFDREKIVGLIERSKRDAELKLAADRPRCPPLKPNSIDLGTLRYGERKVFKVSVSNTGKLDGNFHWVPPPGSILSTSKNLEEDEPSGLPPWIHSYPDEGCVPCGGSKSIELDVCVDREAVKQMAGSEVPITSIFILRVEDASDLFLVVNVEYRQSKLFGLGASLATNPIRWLVLFLLREDLNHLSTPGLMSKSLKSLLPPSINEEQAARSTFSRDLRPLLFSRLASLISGLEERDPHETEDRSLPEGTDAHEAAGLLLLYLSELPSPLLTAPAVGLIASRQPSDPNEALTALLEVISPTEMGALKLVVFLAGKIVEANGSTREEMIQTLSLHVGPRHVQNEIEGQMIKLAMDRLV